MNLKGFFIATLSSALDLGIAVPDDVLRHVTTDVLSIYLPRPLWSRLITACLGASTVDARLVVETVGVPNLCEHVPLQILWALIDEVGQRSLGGVVMASPLAPGSRPVTSRPMPLATPPPPPATEPRATQPPPSNPGPSIPAPGADGEAASSQGRVPPGQRFRPSNSGVGRSIASTSARRPQAQATPPAPPVVDSAAGRTDAIPLVKRSSSSEADFDLETYVGGGGKDDWKNALAVEDEQLVDWSASDEAAAAPPPSDERKR